jgi:hypothetical protein
MRGLTPSLNRRQRKAIYDLVRDHLSGLNDLCIALDRRDYATAERLGLEFGEDFHLLGDLGWAPRDDRERFELTMPEEALIKAAKRLRKEAIDGLSGSEETRQQAELDDRVKTRYRIAADVCDLLLRDPLYPHQGL